MHSISRRLLVLLTLLMLLSFGAMIAVLDARFRRVSERSLRETVDAQMVALIASADPDEEGRVIPRLSQDPDNQLNTPGSGLYAAVLDGDGAYWRSPSAVGSVEEFGPLQAPGARTLRYVEDLRGARLIMVSRSLQWEESGTLTFVVASDMTLYDDNLKRFRRGLAGGFVGVALLLLAALAALLRWGLAPLRRLAREIRAVERGERDRLDDRWPEELHGVVINLNTLLDAERTRIARYRDTLGNLAHSLKTPLSVLRATFTPGTPHASQVNEQVDRMNAIVEHQLRRAATSGGASVGQQAVEVLPVAQELRRTLLKAHARKDFAIELEIGKEPMFVGDRDDLTEALGNLMDNAAKWCGSRVKVMAVLRNDAGAGQKLELAVEDDGPGIPLTERQRVLQRGARADEHTPGHGLGLAMVRDMAGLYGGRLTVGDSTLGGCRVELHLPGRAH